MPDTRNSSNGSVAGASTGSVQGKRKAKQGGKKKDNNNGEKKTETPKVRSKSPPGSTSSSTVTSAHPRGKTLLSNKNPQPAPPKVNLLKRGTTPPQNYIQVMSLMDVQVAKPQGQPETQQQQERKTNVLFQQQSEANKKQTQEYYFSEKPGTAVSADKFQESVQHSASKFPLERNVNILLEKKYILLITPTTSRCNGLYIKVKSQNADDTVTSGALLRSNADDKEIRAACKQTIDDYVKVKAHSERYPFSKVSEPYLSECFIKRLDERQDAFPEAIYYCEKCDYHINTISHAKAHLESSTHFDDIKRQEQRETLLKKIPNPSSAHLKFVNKVLKEALDEYQEIRKQGKKYADNILNYLNTTVFSGIGFENVELRPFGSATYDVVLPDSDYNIAYTMDLPEGTPIFSLLEKVRRKIADDGHPADHSMEMGTPSTILFTFEGVRVRLCWMSCFTNRSQLCFSDLMKTYVGLRKEVVEFLQLIRIWASTAEVDSKNKPRIGLPRYGFDIMAIHFLQKHGFLPVLHEIFEEDGSEDSKTDVLSKEEQARIPPEEAGPRRIRLGLKYEKDLEKIKAKFDLRKSWNAADLFIKFYRYYVQQHRDGVIQITQTEPMSRDINRWSKKILHVVDPFRGDNVLSIPKVSTWQPYYFNCLLTTFLSFAIPRTKKGPVVEIGLIHNPFQKSTTSKKKLKEAARVPLITSLISKPIVPITEEDYNNAADALAEEEIENEYLENLKSKLVIDGIKYAARKPHDCDIDDHVERAYSNRALRRFHRVLDCGLNERIAIALEDSDLLMKKGKGWLKKWRKREEEKVEEITEKMQEKLKVSDDSETLQSSEPTAVVMSVITEQVLPSNSISSDATIKADEVSVKPKTSEDSEVLNTPDVPITPEQAETKAAPEAEVPEAIPEVVEVSEPLKSSTLKSTVAQSASEKLICSEEFFIKENLSSNEISNKSKNLKDYHFEFNNEAFCGNYEMEMKCTHCDGSHCVETCPMMEIPPIQKYEARSAEELKDIDDIIDKYYRENIITQQRLDMMEQRKRELEAYLQKTYRKDVNLTIFGSVMTGLSVNCSDIDICLRFGVGDVPPSDMTPRSVILKTEELLRKSNLAKRVQAIVTAKVPIVKFQLRLRNGENVDADISYYNILAIYNTALLREYTLWTPDCRFAKLALFIKKWAKHCDIGDASKGSLSSYAHIILLISYLQNCDPPVLPRLQEDFLDGSDEKRLVDNWNTSYAQVEEPRVKSWPKNKESCAQLLIGYFDYYSRYDFRNFVVQCRRGMILSKMEKDWPRPICVEDPFDLSHNLSSGVTKKMFVFIMKVFISSRAVFMSEKPQCPRDVNFVVNYQYHLLRKCHQGTAPSDRQCHNCHRIGHFVESCPQRQQMKDNRRRYGSSNSTNSSYRSDSGNKKPKEDGWDSLAFHKRTHYNRTSLK